MSLLRHLELVLLPLHLVCHKPLLLVARAMVLMSRQRRQPCARLRQRRRWMQCRSALAQSHNLHDFVISIAARTSADVPAAGLVRRKRHLLFLSLAMGVLMRVTAVMTSLRVYVRRFMILSGSGAPLPPSGGSVAASQ
jgi:hypothetical protein